MRELEQRLRTQKHLKAIGRNRDPVPNLKLDRELLIFINKATSTSAVTSFR